MMGYYFGFLFLVLALLALMLQRLYSVVPAHELKRLASKDDYLAKALYRPTAYGASLRLLLWMLFGGFLAAGLPLLAADAHYVIAVLISGATSIAIVSLMSMQLTQKTAQFAAWFSSPLTWVLQRTHGLLDAVIHVIRKVRATHYHSRLYEKDDFLQLLAHQREQTDNRISPDILDLAERSLQFGETPVMEVAKPRHKTHLINADETVGPLLLDQMHAEGQRSFLVYKDEPENIVGSLNLSDAVEAKQGGRVLDLVRSDLAFVAEDFSLRDALVAFRETGQQLLVVINNHEEFIGTITLGDLLDALLGKAGKSKDKIAYDNRSAIAAYQAQKTEPAQEPVPIETEPTIAKDQDSDERPAQPPELA